MFLNKYANRPFNNFYFYLSALPFYFSDYIEYKIGVFLNISKKNRFAPRNRFIIPITNITNSKSVTGTRMIVSLKLKFG